MDKELLVRINFWFHLAHNLGVKYLQVSFTSPVLSFSKLPYNSSRTARSLASSRESERSSMRSLIQEGRVLAFLYRGMDLRRSWSVFIHMVARKMEEGIAIPYLKYLKTFFFL